jgi:hypothetical protein
MLRPALKLMGQCHRAQGYHHGEQWHSGDEYQLLKNPGHSSIYSVLV